MIVKIITILEARPQFIKAGSVSKEINRQIKIGVDINEEISIQDNIMIQI